MNLSARSLNDEPLLTHIEERLRASSIEPGRISFEITETAAISDLGSARNWIRRLKDLGCLIALDDFGVGFSSFGYLRAWRSTTSSSIVRSCAISIPTPRIARWCRPSTRSRESSAKK